MTDFSGQTIWITGASSGIGRALALGFAAKGAKLVLSGRNAAALNDVSAQCPGSIAVPFDTTDLDRLPAIVAEVTAHAGPIDILVNNAGISQRSLALETDMIVYRRIMEVDFFAPLALTQLVLPAMVARRQGRLVNISSVAGKVGAPLRSAYSAAKHALIGWSDSLRAETAQYGIQVHVVTPGFVKTDVAVNALGGDGTPMGPHDDPVNNGISAEEAAMEIIAGIEAGTREIPVGRGAEMGLLDLRRQSPPDALFDLMASLAPKVSR